MTPLLMSKQDDENLASIAQYAAAATTQAGSGAGTPLRKKRPAPTAPDHHHTSASRTCATHKSLLTTQVMFRPLCHPCGPLQADASTAACDVYTPEDRCSSRPAPHEHELGRILPPPQHTQAVTQRHIPHKYEHAAGHGYKVRPTPSHRHCCTHTNKLLPELLIATILQYACNPSLSKLLSPHPSTPPPWLSFHRQKAQYSSQPSKALGTRSLIVENEACMLASSSSVAKPCEFQNYGCKHTKNHQLYLDRLSKAQQPYSYCRC
jgi:hypothetical protein